MLSHNVPCEIHVVVVFQASLWSLLHEPNTQQVALARYCSYENVNTLSLKHHVGFEVSPKPCDMSFPEIDTADWAEAAITGSAGATVTIMGSGGSAAPKCVRYNWYQAACMPAVGPELCAIYGDSADWVLGNTLPAPPFIMDVR